MAYITQEFLHITYSQMDLLNGSNLQERVKKMSGGRVQDKHLLVLFPITLHHKHQLEYLQQSYWWTEHCNLIYSSEDWVQQKLNYDKKAVERTIIEGEKAYARNYSTIGCLEN